ncbi:MAG: hypothetical protein Q9227_009478 [Pyrenula ochraceoflavens]
MGGAWVREPRHARRQAPAVPLAQNDSFLTALQYFSGRLPPAIPIDSPPSPTRRKPQLLLEAPPPKNNKKHQRPAGNHAHAHGGGKRVQSMPVRHPQTPHRGRVYELSDSDSDSGSNNIVDIPPPPSHSHSHSSRDQEELIARAVERAMDRYSSSSSRDNPSRAPLPPARSAIHHAKSTPRMRAGPQAQAPNEELWWNVRRRAEERAGRDGRVERGGRWGNATSALQF